MLRKISFLIFGLFLLNVAFSQEVDTVKNWKIGGVGSLSVSQLALHNWAAGGDESVSGLMLFNVFANYKKDSTLKWENYLDVNYGLQKLNGNESRKTDDKLELASKFGKRATKKWYYSAQVTFKTQIDEGKNDGDTVISNFMAPAYVIASVGIDYKPTDNFNLLLSPLTGKLTYIKDNGLSAQGVYGVEPGDKTRYEFGGYLQSKYKFTPITNVDVVLKLNLFSSYLDKPGNIDIENEVNIDLKVNKYLSAAIKANLIYDHDVAIANDKGNEVNSLLQFKEVFGIAFTYKF